MNNLLKKLEEFFKNHSPVIIVNTSTNAALLCLSPRFKLQQDGIFMQFESLNEKGGNSVTVKALQGFEENTLYIENEEENILMLQALNLKNYAHYIKKQYFNAPKFQDEKELKQYILEQKDYVW